MKRTWLIGAALVFSLTAVGCSDDDDDTTDGTEQDGGSDGGRLDGSVSPLDGSLDSSRPDGGDAGDAG